MHTRFVCCPDNQKLLVFTAQRIQKLKGIFLFLLIRFGQTGPEMQQAIYQMSMRLSISPSLYCVSQFSFHKAGTNKKEVWTAV